MIKILWWKLTQWINQAKGEYNDYQLQTEQNAERKRLFPILTAQAGEKTREALQEVLNEEKVRQYRTMYPVLSPDGKRKTFTLTSKEKRTKSKTKRKESK